jgi:hypothetical protein
MGDERDREGGPGEIGVELLLGGHDQSSPVLVGRMLDLEWQEALKLGLVNEAMLQELPPNDKTPLQE